MARAIESKVILTDLFLLNPAERMINITKRAKTTPKPTMCSLVKEYIKSFVKAKSFFTTGWSIFAYFLFL